MKQLTEIPQLPQRDSQSHKGTYGKVLIIGGSFSMTGAPSLVGKSALRTGSGLVRLAIPQSVLPIVAALEPCYTMVPLAEDQNGQISVQAIETVLNSINQNDVIAFGPGCGISDGVRFILEQILKLPIKLVIDADGLNNLSSIYNWHDIKKASLILTPHPGEMKRIWKSVFRDKMPDDRVKTACTYAAQTNSTVVLKGHQTVVADSQNYYINQTGNPGMASAGTGDVLTGMITSLWGQGVNAFDSAVAGVYHHGLAGDRAAKARTQASMIATDLIDNIRI